MDHPSGVGVLDAVAELEEEAQQLFAGPALAEHLDQRGPPDIGHADIGRAFVLAGVQDRDDVGVLERACGLSFAEEAAAIRGLGQGPRQEDLERHRPLELEVPGPVNDAHSAAPDLGLDLVVIEALAGRQPTVT